MGSEELSFFFFFCLSAKEELLFLEVGPVFVVVVVVVVVFCTPFQKSLYGFYVGCIRIYVLLIYQSNAT